LQRARAVVVVCFFLCFLHRFVSFSLANTRRAHHQIIKKKKEKKQEKKEKKKERKRGKKRCHSDVVWKANAERHYLTLTPLGDLFWSMVLPVSSLHTTSSFRWEKR
jgi:hypothetical protein